MTLARLPIVVVAALTLGLGMAWASPAWSQSPGPSPQAAPKPKAFSPTDLQSFARAAVKVKRINETYQPKLQAAQTPEEQQTVRRDATAKMTEAVEKEGLSVDKYNEIYLAARSDPEVANQVNELIEKAR